MALDKFKKWSANKVGSSTGIPDLITPTASLQNLENFSEVSVGAKTSADEEFSDEVKLMRPKISGQYHALDSKTWGKDEKNQNGDVDAEEDGIDNDSDQDTPTQSRTPTFGDLRYSNTSPETLSSESPSSYTKVMRGTDNNHGFDFGFDEESLRPLPHIFDLMDDESVLVEKTSRLSADYEKTMQYQEGNAASAVTNPSRRIPRKPGYGVSKTKPGALSEGSLMADYTRPLHMEASTLFASLTPEKLNHITTSSEVQEVREPQPQPLVGSIDMRFAVHQAADAVLAKPPIPKKSSRRRLAYDHLQNTVSRVTADRTPVLPREQDDMRKKGLEARTDTEDEEDAGEEDSLHLPYYDASELPKGPNASVTDDFHHISVPSKRPKLHPQVIAAEARIAAYKASPEYTQRNKDLAYINQYNKAKKSTISDKHKHSDETAEETRSLDEILFAQSQNRITEMSVNGNFRGMLKDSTFVRMYKDEVQHRCKMGIWWEGWSVVEELRKRGVTSSVMED